MLSKIHIFTLLYHLSNPALSFARNIREKAGRYILRREASRVLRNRKIINLDDATSIGILYYLPDENVYSKISDFVSQLQESGKKVKALGFVKSRRLTGQFLPKLSYDFLYPSGLNWHCKPVSDAAKDFMDTDFDILLDLSMKNMLPLLYIAGLSKAKFKAGSQSDDRKPHLDLMISLRQGDGLDELIAQVSYYLSIINRNNERTSD